MRDGGEDLQMNTRLLRKVAKHIAAEPKRFIMGDLVQTSLERTFSFDGAATFNSEQKFPSCGTAACIAGWTCILSKKRTSLRVAADLLGIKGSFFECSSETARLFDAGEWPEPFGRNYQGAKTPRARVKIAVARIEHFIKTKGKE